MIRQKISGGNSNHLFRLSITNKERTKNKTIIAPKYAGPAFFDDLDKKTWAPVVPSGRDDGDNQGITGHQLPLMLGWAI